MLTNCEDSWKDFQSCQCGIYPSIYGNCLYTDLLCPTDTDMPTWEIIVIVVACITAVLMIVVISKIVQISRVNQKKHGRYDTNDSNVINFERQKLIQK